MSDWEVEMGLATEFTRLVGCRVPIQQAPMGSVSTPDLAVDGLKTVDRLVAIDVNAQVCWALTAPPRVEG